jgi:hypothetical protein
MISLFLKIILFPIYIINFAVEKNSENLNNWVHQHEDSLGIGTMAALVNEIFYIDHSEMHSLFLSVLRCILCGIVGFLVVELLKYLKKKI